MKISLGRCFLTISMIVLCSQSYSMETANPTENKEHAQEEHNDDMLKKLNEACVKLQDAACIFKRVFNPKQYHLVPYHSVNQPAQANKGYLKSLLGRFFNYLLWDIGCPRLQEGAYRQQGPELEQSLVDEVQTSMSEEARMSREANGFKYVLRRMAGAGILGVISNGALLYGLQYFFKSFFNKPLFVKTDPKFLAICGLIFASETIALREIIARIQEIPHKFGVIHAHRENIRFHGLVSPAIAQQLKARPEFQNNHAAHHVIDEMTNDLESV